MDLRKSFATDRQAEQEGTWVPIGEGCSLRVARVGNPAAEKLGRRLLAPHKAALRAGRFDEKEMRAINIRVIAETILLDWKGLYLDGDEVRHSTEEAIRVLTDFPDFRELVEKIADDADNFRTQALADSEGNSGSGSGGSSGGAAKRSRQTSPAA